MVKRKSKSKKKSISRKVKRRTAAKKTAPRKMKAGKPTGREAQAMQRLQSLTERYIAEGLTPADARTRAREELRANPRRDWRGG